MLKYRLASLKHHPFAFRTYIRFKTIRYRNRSKLSEIIIVINYTVHF